MPPVSDYSTAAADNTAISGISLSDATLVLQVDDIARQLMADIRTADDANVKLTGDQTISGTKTFGTAAAGFMRVTTAAASRLDLQATTVADTHERTRLVRDTTAFRQQTTNNDATLAVDDYVATIGASGATQHQWLVEGTSALTVDADGITTLRAPTASAGPGQVTTLFASAGDALFLPAGGQWMYFAFFQDNTSGTVTSGGLVAGVAAGGSNIGGPVVNANAYGFAWRVQS